MTEDRKVQRTGNMHYIYLPSQWCRDKGIQEGSRVDVYPDSSGDLTVSAQRKQHSEQHLAIELKEDDPFILSKLVVSCFTNPVDSFEIDFIKPLNPKEILEQKKLMSTALLEVDEHRIYSDSSMTVTNPLSLFMTNVRKVKNIIQVMIEGYNKELIERFEEEIDQGKVMIYKTVIASLMHRRESRLKLVELHYLSLLNNSIERLTDHLITIENPDEKTKEFLEKLRGSLSLLVEYLKKEKQGEGITHEDAVHFVKQIRDTRMDGWAQALIASKLQDISEVIMDWAITRKVM